MTDLKVTDFEMNETVFVPAGDGQPAQMKPRGDLTIGEFKRHTDHAFSETALHMERTRRYCALIEEATRRCGGRLDTPLVDVMTSEEMSELSSLKMALDAYQREFDRQKAMIERDIAAGDYVTLNLSAAPNRHRGGGQ
jgi:hypothetical protein